jgi:benzil reductase ((S)-benzoin forming)
MTGDRFALVTGTSSGIGAAVARDLLERGWHVVGIARRTPAVQSERYRHLALDLAEVAAAASSIERELGARLAERPWQRIALVNNAANALLGRVEKLDAQEMLRSFALNAVMPLWLMGFVVRRRQRDAPIRIVNISSGAAVRAVPGLAAYCASKAALRMAGMAFATEIGADVSVLSYEPGVVDTDMQREARSKSPAESPAADTFKRYAAEGALVAPEIPAADIVEFLESPAARGFAERRRGA